MKIELAHGETVTEEENGGGERRSNEVFTG